MSPTDAAMVLFALVAAIMLLGLRRIPDGTVYTVHRFGRYVRALGPGLHFTLPLLDRIAHRVSLIGHEVKLPMGSDRSAAVVYFQILDPERAGIALEQIDQMVEQEAVSRLRSLASEADSGSLGVLLKQELNGTLGALGLHVTRCQLRGA